MFYCLKDKKHKVAQNMSQLSFLESKVPTLMLKGSSYLCKELLACQFAVLASY